MAPPPCRPGGTRPSSSSAFHLALGHVAHFGALVFMFNPSVKPRSTRVSLKCTETSPASMSGTGGLALLFVASFSSDPSPAGSGFRVGFRVSIARWHTNRYSLRYVACVAAGCDSAHVSNSRKYRHAPAISPAAAACRPSAKCRCSFALDQPTFPARSPVRSRSGSNPLLLPSPSTPRSRLHDAARRPSGAPSCA